jgi:ubiquinone/menaquinone biosynthesis C-methylase UbiE
VAISNVGKGSKVLDVTAGTGQQAFALHDMPLNIREKALKEMVRVTKPKGVICIVDYGLPHNKMSRALIYHFITLMKANITNGSSILTWIVSFMRLGLKLSREFRYCFVQSEF